MKADERYLKTREDPPLIIFEAPHVITCRLLNKVNRLWQQFSIGPRGIYKIDGAPLLLTQGKPQRPGALLHPAIELLTVSGWNRELSSLTTE
jgi:hypothetical protein